VENLEITLYYILYYGIDMETSMEQILGCFISFIQSQIYLTLVKFTKKNINIHNSK